MIIIETSLGEISIGSIDGHHHDNSKGLLSIRHFHMEYDKALVASSSFTFVTIDFEENIHDQRKMNTQNILQEQIKALKCYRYLKNTKHKP
jgi:hypothetical protein